jgi:uncharacterized SAM-binding protein YcdF (DUF218 family)
MRALATDLVHVFLSLPAYLVAVLAILALASFRRGAAFSLHRWRYALALGAVAGYFASADIAVNEYVGAIERAYPVPPRQSLDAYRGATIVVLTSGWATPTREGPYRSYLTTAGLLRVEAGVELWRRLGGRILFTGAPSPDGADSVAHAMARMAAVMGVPPDAVLVESRSLNTYENLVFSRDLMKASGISQDRLLLVASAMNMPRAAAIAHRLGMNVLAYPCDYRSYPRSAWQDWVPSNDGARAFEEVMHELIGILSYRMRGWA